MYYMKYTFYKVSKIYSISSSEKAPTYHAAAAPTKTIAADPYITEVHIGSTASKQLRYKDNIADLFQDNVEELSDIA